MAGCDTRETTPETTYPQTAIQTLDETSACKAAIGYAAVQVVPEMTEEESVNHDARITEIIRYFDEQGSFPAECNAYHLSEMRPWMGYAGNLVWFCDTIDPNAIVDTSQMLGDRSLADWLNEYLIPCPL